MPLHEKDRIHVRWAHVALWLPAIAAAIGYAVLLLLVLTSSASARPSTRARGPAATVRFVETQGVVQAGSVTAFTGRCPTAAPHAVGPEFGPLNASDDGQVAVAGSFPVGGSGWTVVVKNLSAQTREYFAGIVCVGAPHARFAFVRTSGVAQAQRDDWEIVSCPRAAPHALGSTFQMQAGSAEGSAVVDQTFAEVNKRGRVNGTQIGGMRNLTDIPVGILLGAACTSLPVDVTFGGVTAPAGKIDSYDNSCLRRRELAVGGQFYPTTQRDSGSLILAGFGWHGRAVWGVGVNNLATHPVPYVVGAVCLA